MKKKLLFINLLLISIVLLFSLFSCNDNGNTADNNDNSNNNKPHTHVPGLTMTENMTPATCSENGYYDLVVYCEDCEEELSREREVLESKGHVPGDPIEESYVHAGCFTEGKCTLVIYCTVCSEELGRDVYYLPATGHRPADPIQENPSYTGCKTNGTCITIIKCSQCEEELSRTIDTIAPRGHRWVNDKCEDCGIPFSVEESLEFALSNDGTYYIITGIGTFYGTELYMPSEYNGLPVKEIADYAFVGCDFVTYAFIPASITRLGYGAAMDCTALLELELEDRRGWFLYYGQEDPQIDPIPSIFLSSFKKDGFLVAEYFENLITKDEFALVKK